MLIGIILKDLIIAFAKSDSTEMVLVVPISMSATPTHVIKMLRALVLVVTNVLAMMDTVATESSVATSMNAHLHLVLITVSIQLRMLIVIFYLIRLILILMNVSIKVSVEII